MKTTKKVAGALEHAGAAIGVGIMAGLIGTAAITLSQMIEMKITKRKESTVPADAVTKTMDITVDETKKKEFSHKVHWVYGTSWGIARGVLALIGLKRLPATTAHFAAVLGTAMIIEPALKLAPPVKEWGIKEILIDAMHHAVYAAAAGIVYDAITCNKED